MPHIHPSAVVSPKAQLADDVVVGPFSYIEDEVVIGPGCKLLSHVTIRGGTTIGKNNTFAQSAIIGGDPQDRRYSGEKTYLKIGDDNVFREFVTIHRATGEGNSTVIENRNFIMASVHLGHNGHIMNDVTITNSVDIAGHVTIEDRATIGGMTGIHQFARIGKLAMVGGISRIVRDVPPFMIVAGQDQTVHDINAVGLRRMGLDPAGRMALHKACKLLFKSQLSLRNALETVAREVPETEEVKYLVAFLERLYLGKNGRGDQR